MEICLFWEFLLFSFIINLYQMKFKFIQVKNQNFIDFETLFSLILD